jgi:hypothetical protein
MIDLKTKKEITVDIAKVKILAVLYYNIMGLYTATVPL